MHLQAATKGNVVKVVIQLRPQDRTSRFKFVQVVSRFRQSICVLIGKHYFESLPLFPWRDKQVYEFSWRFQTYLPLLLLLNNGRLWQKLSPWQFISIGWVCCNMSTQLQRLIFFSILWWKSVGGTGILLLICERNLLTMTVWLTSLSLRSLRHVLSVAWPHFCPHTELISGLEHCV